jgi:hypothetical protein
MARREQGVNDRAQEAERYREAAELALDQLRWCIEYLYRIRKPTLAKGLKRNREHILADVRRIAQQGSRARE